MPLLIVPLCKVSAVASDWDGWISGVCSLALHRRSISAQHTDATVSAATLWLRAEIKQAFLIIPPKKKEKTETCFLKLKKAYFCHREGELVCDAF